MIGLLAGGLLLEHFWWGSVFLLAVPVMGLILLLGPRLLPEYRDPDAGRLEDPLVDLRLFRAPASSAALGMNRTALFVVFGSEPRRSQGRRSWRRSRC